MADLLLGIDIGTASSKGVLATPDGELVATATRRHTMSLPRAGYAEMDAETIWWDDVVRSAASWRAAQPRRRRRLREWSGPVPAADRRAASTAATGDPVRHRHPGDRGDRRAHRAIRRGCDPRRAGRLSTQAIGPKLLWLRRPAGVWRAGPMVQLQLVRRGPADRRVGARPPHGQPVRPLLRHPRAGLGEDWAERCWPAWRCRGWSGPRRWSGAVSTAAAATGLAGTPVVAGTVDAWAEAFSSGYAARRPDADVRLHDVLRAGADRADEWWLWTTIRCRPRHTLAAGMATSGTITTGCRT